MKYNATEGLTKEMRKDYLAWRKWLKAGRPAKKGVR